MSNSKLFESNKVRSEWNKKKAIIKLALLCFISLTFFSHNSRAQTVTDIEGNVYNTVTLGTQVWMAKNLKTTKYNDGTLIPNVTDSIQWYNLITGAYCNYNNDAGNADIYGRLYNWYAVNTKKLCPTGWHAPSKNEWVILKDYLIANGYNYDGTTTGNKIGKSMAFTTGWAFSDWVGYVGTNPETNNSTGFTGLPGGRRAASNGAFDNVGMSGYWWSSDSMVSGPASYWYLTYLSYSLISMGIYEQAGLSERCLLGSISHIDKIDNKVEIKIYPNPATNKITISIPSKATPDNYRIEILNIDGQIIRTNNNCGAETTLDLVNLSSGVYTIKVKTDKEIAIQKFIKQ